MSHEAHTLDYANRTNRSSVQWRHVLRRVLAWLVIAVLAVALPMPRGIWYFGPRSQWLVAVDWSGLTVGSSTSALSLGWLPLIAIKLAVLAIPLVLIQRTRRRKLRGDSAGG